MKWTRAVHHLEELVDQCAEMAERPTSIVPLRVVQLWAFGDILGEQQDLERVGVALAVDLPVEDVPWWSEPAGSQQWANATRLLKNPFIARWRSVRAPIWNHVISRPALVWDTGKGFAEETMTALREGQGESVRLPASTPDELRTRLDGELAVSLGSLREHTRVYDDRRWVPGKMEPFSDALWRASDGYLDVLDALG
ncbi:MAG: hypothetical protein JWQ81_8759 [Amycolatopsis sp.]|jgi:hypothetical protein|uniref:DUF7711 family protein n=1 Tax=Amycolatopsis sp. TaxID=37632 RepID=UPI00260CAA61|nr:hypothetical protein [Amycolatopsis sp.]MCU1688020.1 hypothetical protein [Amycolatopsis sp.]